ncbi:hypothetical protein [Bradyrhizobium sp. USDA 329]|uniref:hypothetical protein n=1 Tax=unclassified Bradyrhizobium TaxID=2631580 RepID=UPI0035159BBA
MGITEDVHLPRHRVDRARDPHPSPAANSISIAPMPAGPTGPDVGSDSATTIGGTKPA